MNLVKKIAGKDGKDKEESTSSSSKPSKEASYQQPQESGLVPATATYIEVPTGSSMKEKGGDFMSNIRKTRTKASSLTTAEQIQLDKLRRVFEGVFGAQNIPSEFKVETKNALGDGVMGTMAKSVLGDLVNTTEGFKPDSEYFHTTNWYRGIDSANGKYRPEAKAMINIICTFQSNKSKGIGVSNAGYPDDPENLFLEEFKTWVKDHFANFAEKDKENIRKRCGYLEDILCKEGLFDRPNSGDKYTVQKVVVEVRRILKATISIIDAALTHVDAGRSLEEIMDYLRLFMDESASLLWYSFREKNVLEGQSEGSPDRAERLHRAVLSSKDIKAVLPHRSQFGGVAAPRSIGFNDRGKLELLQEFLPKPKDANNSAVVPSNKFIEIAQEEQLMRIFSGDDSGFDRNFRDNYVVASLYLEAYALLGDLGSLYGVLKQAKGAAQTGGTMLLYGAANAHFNALLELTERLTDNMRTRLSKIVEIGEARFEQLVEINWATTSRCSWIGNYRELPRILVQVEKNATELFRCVGKARSEANALTLKERKDQAEEETQNFLTAAEGLTKTAGKSLNIQYNSYKSLETAEKTQASVEKVTKDLKKKDASEMQKELQEEEKQKKEFLEQMKTSTLSTGDRRYYLEIATDTSIGSGTDADVFIQLVGTKEKTINIDLPDDDKTKFEQGSLDRFDLVVEKDIGDVTAIKLGISGGGDKIGADWRIKSVELVDKTSSKRYYFDCKGTKIGGSSKKEKNEATFTPGAPPKSPRTKI